MTDSHEEPVKATNAENEPNVDGQTAQASEIEQTPIDEPADEPADVSADESADETADEPSVESDRRSSEPMTCPFPARQTGNLAGIAIYTAIASLLIGGIIGGYMRWSRPDATERRANESYQTARCANDAFDRMIIYKRIIKKYPDTSAASKSADDLEKMDIAAATALGLERVELYISAWDFKGARRALDSVSECLPDVDTTAIRSRMDHMETLHAKLPTLDGAPKIQTVGELFKQSPGIKPRRLLLHFTNQYVTQYRQYDLLAESLEILDISTSALKAGGGKETPETRDELARLERQRADIVRDIKEKDISGFVKAALAAQAAGQPNVVLAEMEKARALQPNNPIITEMKNWAYRALLDQMARVNHQGQSVAEVEAFFFEVERILMARKPANDSSPDIIRLKLDYARMLFWRNIFNQAADVADDAMSDARRLSGSEQAASQTILRRTQAQYALCLFMDAESKGEMDQKTGTTINGVVEGIINERKNANSAADRLSGAYAISDLIFAKMALRAGDNTNAEEDIKSAFRSVGRLKDDEDLSAIDFSNGIVNEAEIRKTSGSATGSTPALLTVSDFAPAFDDTVVLLLAQLGVQIRKSMTDASIGIEAGKARLLVDLARRELELRIETATRQNNNVWLDYLETTVKPALANLEMLMDAR